jgi:hypothetical protein
MSFFILTGLQAFLMFFDEFYFHRRRDLPRWERWGHPMDTAAFIFPFILLIFGAPLLWFSITAGFSCLFITKDEWIHRKHCSGTENWLHAVLFIIHPLVFVSAWMSREEVFPFLPWFVLFSATFMIYQIYYWNFYDYAPVRK